MARSRRRADGSLTTTASTPIDTAQATAARPMGPAPSTATRSDRRHPAAPEGAPHDGQGLHQGLLVGQDRCRELEQLVGPHRHELGEPTRVAPGR